MRPRFLGLGVLLIAVLLLPACGESGPGEGAVRVQIKAASDGRVVGTAWLSEVDGAARYDVRLEGARAGERYLVTLHGGSCEHPSASFAPLAEIQAGGDGAGSAEGPVLFRAAEAVELGAVADGEHVLVMHSGDGEACGVVPPFQAQKAE